MIVKWRIDAFLQLCNGRNKVITIWWNYRFFEAIIGLISVGYPKSSAIETGALKPLQNVKEALKSPPGGWLRGEEILLR